MVIIWLSYGYHMFISKVYLDVGQNGRPRGPQMEMSSLVLTIQLLRYLILTHTHMENHHNQQQRIFFCDLPKIDHASLIFMIYNILEQLKKASFWGPQGPLYTNPKFLWDWVQDCCVTMCQEFLRILAHGDALFRD
jgi:hypothetical protein